MKKNNETLIGAVKDDGLEVNAQESITCCCLVTRKQGKVLT
jgi:hypothetical protein